MASGLSSRACSTIPSMRPTRSLVPRMSEPNHLLPSHPADCGSSLKMRTISESKSQLEGLTERSSSPISIFHLPHKISSMGVVELANPGLPMRSPEANPP